MKKLLGRILLVIGICGFFAGNIVKSKSSILEKKYTQTGVYTVDLSIEPGNTYTCFFWGVDEEMGTKTDWAGMEFSAKIVDSFDDKILFNEHITASASSAEEKGGIKRAQNGKQFQLSAEHSSDLKISMELVAGDELTLDVYKNLPEFLNMAPGLSILLGLVGIVLIFRANASS